MSFFGEVTYLQSYEASGGRDVMITPTTTGTTASEKSFVALTDEILSTEIDDAYTSVLSQIESVISVSGNFSTFCTVDNETIILTAASIDASSNPTVYFIGEGSIKLKGTLIKYLDTEASTYYIAVEYEEVSGGGGATIVQSGNTLSIS